MSLFERGPAITCPKCGHRARVREIAKREAAWYQQRERFGLGGDFFTDSIDHDYIGGWRGAGTLCSVCGNDVPDTPAPTPRTDVEMLALLATRKEEKGG